MQTFKKGDIICTKNKKRLSKRDRESIFIRSIDKGLLNGGKEVNLQGRFVSGAEEVCKLGEFCL